MYIKLIIEYTPSCALLLYCAELSCIPPSPMGLGTDKRSGAGEGGTIRLDGGLWIDICLIKCVVSNEMHIIMHLQYNIL